MTTDVNQKIREFFARYPERTFAKGELIIHAGEEPSGVFFIEQGRVSQYDISPNGTEVVVNVFKPRAFFPMSWAINKTPNQYFFEASDRVVARQAPAEEVVAFLRSEPDVVFNLLSRVFRGADGLLRRVAHLMAGDAKSRLLFEILNAAYRFGTPHPDGGVLVPLKEGDLARHSGLARETVSRVMQKLKAAGLAEVTKDGLYIPDVHSLEQELGSDL
jgi:CRP/FNR family transcriptional regulator, cyclic AMP receptor protein